MGLMTINICLAPTMGMMIAAGAIGGAAAGFASGIIGPGMAGANLRDALGAGFKGALSGATFGAIGGAFSQSSGFFKQGGMGHILSHGLASGILTDLEGGNFGNGFLTAGITKFSTVNLVSNIGGKSFGAIVGRTTMAGMIGGTTSVMTGGKFANGAKTSALAHVVNAESGNLLAFSNRILNYAQAQKMKSLTTVAQAEKLMDTPAGQAVDSVVEAAREKITLKAGFEFAKGAGATVQATMNLNGDKGYEISYNKGVMFNPIGSVSADVFSTGELKGSFQSLEFCAVGCIGVEKNYKDWAFSTTISTGADLNFQTGFKGDF